MSPEQALSSGEDIDTRIDIYSLGIIFYELLAGVPPLELRRIAFDEFLRRLREEEPPKPSTKIRTQDPATSTDVARKRQTEPLALARQMRGDLDSIALKALEKDRSRRYGSAAELAADIRRYLRNEPVTAHQPDVIYQARKYVRRHRMGVAASVALVLLAAGAGIVQTIELRRVTRERDRADRITSFMTSMFTVTNPSEARGNKVTAREILDKASKDIDTSLTKDPELQAQMMHTMAETYVGLGLYPRGESLLRRAIDINRRVLSLNDPIVLRWNTQLAETLWAEGRYGDAEELQRKTLDADRQVLGPEHPDTLKCMNILGTILEFEGRFRDAEHVQLETLDRQRRVLGSEHPETLKTEGDLASILRDEGRFADSEKAYRRVLEFDRRFKGEDHPETLFNAAMLSDVLRCERQFVQSENLARKTLEAQRRILGPDHIGTLDSMAILAQTLQGEGKYAAAEELQRDSLERRRRSLGQDHPTTLRAIAILGSILNEEGRYREAQKLEREALDTQRRMFGSENFDTATTTYYLACSMALKGDKDQAFALLGQAVLHAMPEIDAAIEDEPGFKSLHGDPRFSKLVLYVKQKISASQKAN